MKRYLVTTAIEETWPDNEPVLFLGEWCRLYSRKDQWSQMDAEVLPYHWDDRDKLHSDYRYLIDLHEILLVELTQKLNTIHEVNHSVRYWRILIGPWLGYFTQILFDRWSSLKEVDQHYDISGTTILKGDEQNLIPNDMYEFIAFFLEDKWNHHIYSLILQNSFAFNCVDKDQEFITKKGEELQTVSGRITLKNKFRKFISGSLKILQRNTDAFFITTYLPLRDEIKLNLLLRQFPQFRERIQPENIKLDLDQREWVLNGKSFLDFELLVRTIIPLQIPKIYLEGYSILVTQTNLLNWPKRPKLIFTSNSHHSEDIFNAWAAQKVENGTRLIIGQHGGNYGIGRLTFVEDHEIAIGNAFISWGWSDKTKPEVRPVGMLKNKHPLNIDHGKQPHILLVEHINPRQSYYLFSSAMSRQWLDYLDDQFRFVESLPQTLRDTLIVRLHPQDWGWAPYLRWRDRFPALRIDQSGVDIMATICYSRIYVSTYNATTFLESLAMDVPTVIYWNAAHWELRDSAIPYFDELKRIGVFHETPESAANHVAKVWDNVEGWWNLKDVQEVLNSFKKNYCNVYPNLIQNLGKTLKGFYPSEKYD